MVARDLAAPVPWVGIDDNALDAARVVARAELPWVVVRDTDGRPTRVLPGTAVLRFLTPRYVQDDAALARVIGERGSRRLLGQLAGKRVRDLLDELPDAQLAVAGPDDTVLELAVTMSGSAHPVVAVVDDDRLLGCVTLPRLLDALLALR
jgi:CBS domain-containing protein